MGYCDTSDAELIALTRERRREELLRVHMADPMDGAAVERAYRRLHGPLAPLPWAVVRFTVHGDEFTPSIACCPLSTRRKTAAKAWRMREWKAGNRSCHYCRSKMEPVPRKGLPGLLCVTVDHKEPLCLGGDDAPWNWAMCCWGCNNRKGALTEAEFFAPAGCGVGCGAAIDSVTLRTDCPPSHRSQS